MKHEGKLLSNSGCDQEYILKTGTMVSTQENNYEQL